MRDKLDRYYTPDLFADACLSLAVRALAEQSGKTERVIRFIEPCTGGGAFLRAAERAGHIPVGGCDVDPDAPGLKLDGVERTPLNLYRPPRADLVITNYPYKMGPNGIRQLLQVGERAGAGLVATVARETVLYALVREGLAPAWAFGTTQRPKWEGPGRQSQTDFVATVLLCWPMGDVPKTDAIRVQHFKWKLKKALAPNRKRDRKKERSTTCQTLFK